MSAIMLHKEKVCGFSLGSLIGLVSLLGAGVAGIWVCLRVLGKDWWRMSSYDGGSLCHADFFLLLY